MLSLRSSVSWFPLQMGATKEEKSAPGERKELVIWNIATGEKACAGHAALAIIGCDDIKRIPELQAGIDEQYNSSRAYLQSMQGCTLTYVNVCNTSGGFATALVLGRTHPEVLRILEIRAQRYQALFKEAADHWGVVIRDFNFNTNTQQLDNHITPVNVAHATILG